MAQLLLDQRNSMGALLVHLALLLYAAASAAFLAWLARPDPRLPRAGWWVLFAGVVVHAGVLAPRILGRVPETWDGARLVSPIAAAMVVAYLVLDRRGRMPVAGAFVAPMVVAMAVTAHLVHAHHAVAPRLWTSASLYIHVGAATLGTAAMAVAFGLAAVYLLSERQAKLRQPGRLFARVPSLEAIDRSGSRLAVFGFILLSLAIATGAVASQAAFGSALRLAPKQAFSLLAWAVLAASIEARLVAGWRGRRAALLTVAGFAMLVGAYAVLLTSSPAQRATMVLGEWP